MLSYYPVASYIKVTSNECGSKINLLKNESGCSLGPYFLCYPLTFALIPWNLAYI